MELRQSHLSGEGNDSIAALGGGNDTVWGDGGNDRIEGGHGNDQIRGGAATTSSRT